MGWKWNPTKTPLSDIFFAEFKRSLRLAVPCSSLSINIWGFNDQLTKTFFGISVFNRCDILFDLVLNSKMMFELFLAKSNWASNTPSLLPIASESDDCPEPMWYFLFGSKGILASFSAKFLSIDIFPSE